MATLESVIAELRGQGYQVLYSSDLVPPDLQAPAREPGESALTWASRVLQARGLVLKPINGRTYVVSRLPESAGPVLDADAGPMPEISVYASRYAIDAGLAEPRKLELSDIERVPGSHDDALRSLHSIPGVVSTASARPYIRGSLSEDVLVRYDGIPIVDPFHFKNFQNLISAIDPAAIAGIEVFSGGFPVRYGTRSGGVIDIAAPTTESGREYQASLSLISAGVSARGHGDELPVEWLGAIRHSILDLLEPVEDGFGSPEFSDSVGRVRWKTEAGTWIAGWLLLSDRLDLNSGDGAESAVGRYRDEYFWVGRDHRFDDALSMRTNVVLTSAERNRAGTLTRPGVASGLLDEQRRFDGVELLSDWNFAAGASSTYSFGGSLAATRARHRYQRFSAFSPEVSLAFGRAGTESLQYAQNPEVVSYSWYAANRRRWSRTEAELGLRMDAQHYVGGSDHAQLSPRLSIRHDLSEQLRVYASAGRFTQAQHVEEWRAEEAQQEPDAAQISNHAIIGLQWTAYSGLAIGAEAYQKKWNTSSAYFDSSLDPLGLLPDLAPDRVRIAPASSEASGLELNLRAPLGPQLSASGTLAWARVADDLDGAGDVLRSWDQPLSLSAGLAWKNSRAGVSALLGWHRGWPRTPVDLEPLTLGARNSIRWADFYSLDLRASWNWAAGDGDFSAVLDVTNSTNRRNECCFVLESRDAAPSGDTEHWLPLLVNLGFTYRWHR
jgi:outer membrane receptor protein involved in Fe transport